VAPYDASTGEAELADGSTVSVQAHGGLQSVFGSDAWKWLLVGTVGR
jgi:hypothetical protein